MPMPCSICNHRERMAIDRALVSRELSRAKLAAKYRVSADALDRHAAHHLPRLLVEAREARDSDHASAVLDQYDEDDRKLRLLIQACDEWLADPQRPDRYTLAPRAEEIEVCFLALNADGEPVRGKAPLSALLGMLREERIITTAPVTWKTADPRTLLPLVIGRRDAHRESMLKVKEAEELRARVGELEAALLALSPIRQGRRA
jgi:hypothetical protein